MSPRFNSGKSMSQIEHDYICDSISSPDGTTSCGDDLANESGRKTTATNRTSKQKSKTKKVQLCVVCNDVAAGTYFGAAVCLPCKSFYIRCTKDDPNPKFSCAFGNKCEINKQNRLRCQSCRFKKCLEAGMHRKEKLDYVEPSDGQELCLVCGDIANGCHFGIFTCEGCKKFYRRGMHEADTYQCKADRRCAITPRTRNDCRYCRFQKCIAVGMSRQAIKMGRPKKVQRRDETMKSEPVQVTTTVSQDVEIQMDETSIPKLLMPERKPEISSLMATECFSAEDGTKKIPNTYREPTTTAASQYPDSTPDCGGSLVGVQPLIPVCLPSLVEVKARPAVDCDSSLVVDTSQEPAIGKQKEEASATDLMFSSANVEVDLDNFIRTLDEQEEAILSAQVEHITSTSGSEYGEIIHWLKDKESGSPQNFFQAAWDPIKGSPNSPMAAPLSSGPSAQFASDLPSPDGGVQPLKPLAGPTVYQPLGGDYITLTSQRTEQQQEPLVLSDDMAGGGGDGHVLPAAGDVMADEAIAILGEPSNAEDGATRPNNPSRSLGAPPSDIWLRHRSTENKVQQDDSEMVTSTGQVKRRPFDSDISEVAPKVFRMDYWISHISVEIPNFTEQHHKLLSKLQTAYEALVEHADESKIPPQKNTLHAAEEARNSLKSVTKRIIRSLSAAMNFALSIPGFKRVEQSDQFHLVKYGGFHMMIILAGREQYIPEKHTFKYFWNAPVPNSHPAYRLRHDLLEAGKAIYWLKLDQIEAAALGALALISTDWLQLNFPHRLEAINKPVLESFLAYVIDKHGRMVGKTRIQEMFQLMPTLRELTLRHAYYMQNLQLVVDASELVKMCECITLNDRR